MSRVLLLGLHGLAELEVVWILVEGGRLGIFALGPGDALGLGDLAVGGELDHGRELVALVVDEDVAVELVPEDVDVLGILEVEVGPGVGVRLEALVGLHEVEVVVVGQGGHQIQERRRGQ